MGNIIKPDFAKSEGRVRPCDSISPISACFAMSSKPAASPTAPSARIWRWPQPRRASATWRTRSACALLTRGRQGVTPTQAGRTLLQHARTILRQAERLHEDLGAYGGGFAGQIRVLSNTNALTEFLPEALSSFLAAHPNVSVDLEERLERRDRRPDRRRRRRSRRRRRHGRCRRARNLSVPPRPLRAGGRAGPSVGASAPRSASKTCSSTISSASTAPAPLQRFLAAKAVRIGRPLRLRVQLRSFDAVCRLVECKVGIGIVPETTARRVSKTMAIAIVPLTDPWAVRDLTICVRSHERVAALRAAAGRAFAGDVAAVSSIRISQVSRIRIDPEFFL